MDPPRFVCPGRKYSTSLRCSLPVEQILVAQPHLGGEASDGAAAFGAAVIDHQAVVAEDTPAGAGRKQESPAGLRVPGGPDVRVEPQRAAIAIAIRIAERRVEPQHVEALR